MNVEEKCKGRAIIESWADTLIITIPMKTRILLIIFLAAWLVGWSVGEYSVLKVLYTQGGINIFLASWLIMWTIGGILAIIILLWNTLGKEVVKVLPNTIKIEKVLLGIRRSKEYAIEDIKNFRVELNNVDKGMELWGITGGLIKFDYGMKTIKFGIATSINEAEAHYILEQIEKHIGLSK